MGGALALACLAVCGAQEMEVELEISGGLVHSGQMSASSIYNRLVNAVSVDEAGRPVDGFDMLRGISPDGMIVEDVAPDPGSIGVDVSSDTGMRAVAGGNFEVTAGGRFDGKIIDRASLTAGGRMDLQSLDGVSVMSGDDVDMSASGDVSSTASGHVALDAMSAAARLAGTAGIVSGGEMRMSAGGGGLGCVGGSSRKAHKYLEHMTHMHGCKYLCI